MIPYLNLENSVNTQYVRHVFFFFLCHMTDRKGETRSCLFSFEKKKTKKKTDKSLHHNGVLISGLPLRNKSRNSETSIGSLL